MIPPLMVIPRAYAGLKEAERRILPQAISMTPVPSLSVTCMVTSSAESLASSSVSGTSASFALGSYWKTDLLENTSVHFPGSTKRASRICLPLGTIVLPKFSSLSDSRVVGASAPIRQTLPGWIA